MKLSYNWLKEYLKCDLSPEQVAEAMTSIGIEVDSLEMQEVVPGGLKNVVVGIVDQFKFPIKFLGIGEGVEDLKVFDKKEFVEDLFKLEDIQ